MPHRRIKAAGARMMHITDRLSCSPGSMASARPAAASGSSCPGGSTSIARMVASVAHPVQGAVAGTRRAPRRRLPLIGRERVDRLRERTCSVGLPALLNWVVHHGPVHVDGMGIAGGGGRSSTPSATAAPPLIGRATRPQRQCAGGDPPALPHPADPSGPAFPGAPCTSLHFPAASCLPAPPIRGYIMYPPWAPLDSLPLPGGWTPLHSPTPGR